MAATLEEVKHTLPAFARHNTIHPNHHLDDQELLPKRLPGLYKVPHTGHTARAPPPLAHHVAVRCLVT